MRIDHLDGWVNRGHGIGHTLLVPWRATSVQIAAQAQREFHLDAAHEKAVGRQRGRRIVSQGLEQVASEGPAELEHLLRQGAGATNFPTWRWLS